MYTDTSITMLDINTIIPNKYQPRKIFDEKELNTLAESIKEYGIINPILVRKKNDKYEIIAGERRFRAAKLIGLTKVPVIIKNADEQEMAELALIENIQRQGLSPIEEAKSYEEIMRIGNHTQQSLAKKVGKSQAAIANKIRLLSLPQEIQDALANRKISERHARSLLSIGNKGKQIKLLNKIMTDKLTVKETEQIIKNQEIDDDEIQEAISDIMKSLNIKEDEKEDDNMNNGNFFPNFDNNNTMNNNASLNMMNIQSLNQSPMEVAPEVVMPTVNTPMSESMQMPFQQTTAPIMEAPQPILQNIEPQMSNMQTVDQNVAPITSQFTEVAPTMNGMNAYISAQDNIMTQPMNSIEPQMVNPVPETTLLQPTIEQPVSSEIPLFNIQPEIMNQPVEQQPISSPLESSIPMFDVPLFNQNIVIPSEPSVQNVSLEQNQVMTQVNPTETNPVETIQPLMTPNSFEVPVEISTPIEPQIIELDKLTKLQELLTNNGHTFKTFSNDTENCIIIEIPRN